MLRIIEDLPERVLGLEAVGQVTADDYRTVLVPAVESLVARHAKVRLLYVLGDRFEGFSGGAAWEDARLGMRHFTDFDRVAVVTDADWVTHMVRAFGFVLPGEVRTFGSDQLDEARAWVSDVRPGGHLEFELREDTGVLILRPQDELETGDFERVAAAVDPYIEAKGGLAGIVVVAEEFPGWDGFSAMASHFRFVRDHHRSIRRVALVTSSRFLSALPRLARHFVDAEVRHFAPEASDEALRWVSGAR